VVEQARRLVAHGVAEIVLTGVDMTAYGEDLPERPGLGALCRDVLRALPGLKRLRLSSLDTVEADAALLAAIAEEERLMPHFHLSLQSGDDLILKRMKRRHSAADALAFVAAVRERRPEAAFGADVIAGFPTETDRMFENTLAHLRDCGIASLHVFPFSSRPGTPAARMPQLPSEVVRARARSLRACGEELRRTYLGGEAGTEREVLFETPRMGRTPQFVPVEVDADMARGNLRSVRIAAARGGGLVGRLTA
jgi:threonylcarbamoyladenosine tRNA methylthiotransferase MtaB